MRSERAGWLLSAWLIAFPEGHHEEGAVSKGDRFRCMDFNVRCLHVGIVDTWMAVFLEEKGTGQQRVRDRVKEAGAHCLF